MIIFNQNTRGCVCRTTFSYITIDAMPASSREDRHLRDELLTRNKENILTWVLKSMVSLVRYPDLEGDWWNILFFGTYI